MPAAATGGSRACCRGVFLVLVGLCVLAAAAEVSAQTGSANTPLRVSVVVIRSCAVETGGHPPTPGHPAFSTLPSAEPRARIRCSQQVIMYPVQPGTGPTPGRDDRVPVRVQSSSDKRGATVQF